jgi:hypothetical protein
MVIAHPSGEPTMQRTCTQCRHPFTLADLSREETANLESERKAHGLEGIKFLYFHCPACGMDDIFVGILPLETEFIEDYEARRDAMEKVVRGLHGQGVEAVVVPLQVT